MSYKLINNNTIHTVLELSDLVNDLTSSGTTKALTAEAGRVLKDRDGVGKIIVLGNVRCEYYNANYLVGRVNISGINYNQNTHRVFVMNRYVPGTAAELITNIMYTVTNNQLEIWPFDNHSRYTKGHTVEVDYMIVDTLS